jgi:hypothetical protein
MGDFNVKIGNSEPKGNITTFGDMICINNGGKLIDFVLYNNIVT